jgi:hypothetical protein
MTGAGHLSGIDVDSPDHRCAWSPSLQQAVKRADSVFRKKLKNLPCAVGEERSTGGVKSG